MRLFLVSIVAVVVIATILSLTRFSSSTANQQSNIRYQDTTTQYNPTFYMSTFNTIFSSHKKILKKTKKENIDSNTRYIYLTFDDGPDAGTPIVRRILKEEDVPATFFIVGWHVITHGPKYRKLFEDTLMNDPQILCANHSFSHAYFNNYVKFYKDVKGGVQDIVRNQDTCHFKNQIVRGPGSNVWWTKTFYKQHRDYYNRKQMMDSLAKLGFIIIGWDLEWSFNNKERLKESTKQMLYYVNKFFEDSLLVIPNHLVLLMHDRTVINPTDSHQLQDFIIALKKDKKYHYEFQTLSDYPLVKEGEK